MAKTAYTNNRFIYDADAHLVEGPFFLKDYADSEWRDRVPLTWSPKEMAAHIAAAGIETDVENAEHAWEAIKQAHKAEDYRDKRLENVLQDKQLGAFGAFDTADRRIALDQMGFQKQVVFNTFSNEVLQKLEEKNDIPLIRAAVRAHNRGMVDFCKADSRLFPAGYVPLTDREGAATIAAEAVKLGCKILIVAQPSPRDHSPTHEDLETVWAIAAEAGTPIAMHVGGGGEVLAPGYDITGRAKTPQFTGGEGPMHSLRVLQLANPAKTLVAAMIYDGVFQRHPNLHVGVYELGCMWLPSFIRELDAVARGFPREPRLKQLDMLPSEYAIRQLKVTPYPYEDVGWVMEQACDRMVMFCSDYPHHEGGRDPLRRFDDWLKDASETTKRRFYVENFAEFFGGGLPILDTIAA